ncbi:orotidine-5'-phosphate decarboxylase [Curtobacterium ammoniigenes]|uniref:orotidine-5'-phosphate decarboxylase n=1 Tax=Curtobacterium ammoniigenes TaxID=395387 RepID=UPI000A7C76F2|nr:orotidine-5'-phosphate decarboxylase [Curtobacterium ammoniigenes]
MTDAVGDATPARASFGARLAEAMRRRSPLCVGIDPHPSILEAWGLRADRDGLEAFGRLLVDAAAGRAAVVKPQVAFFERAGAAGFEALARIIDHAHASGLLVIADAKRGDIGTTAAAYADAWLNPAGAFHADAVTLSPYLGFGSLAGSIDAAREWGSGVFVLAATSNPEGRPVQTAIAATSEVPGRTVAAGIVAQVAAANTIELDSGADAATGQPGASALGSIGLVLGATLALDEYGLDLDTLGPTPVLAPGFGAQGARIEALRLRFGGAAGRVLVSESRGITDAGPSSLGAAVQDRVERIAAALG